MKFFDAHVHFIHQSSMDEIKNKLGLMEENGCGGMDVLVIAEFPPDRDTVLKMIPGEYHRYITLETLENQRDPFPLLNSSCPLTIIPFVDARFIEEDMEQKVKTYRQMGFKGLKLLYVPEEDQLLRVGGMEKAFKRTHEESERITSRLIDGASSGNMPVLIHADLRKHGKFIEEMIRSHPYTNFNLPHFGFSRRAISSLLEKHPNCYTDLSSMVPFMKKDPVSYKSFIQRYQDKILFGSDALIDQPEQIHSALKSVGDILVAEEILDKIMNRNHNLFHAEHSESLPSQHRPA